MTTDRRKHQFSWTDKDGSPRVFYGTYRELRHVQKCEKLHKKVRGIGRPRRAVSENQIEFDFRAFRKRYGLTIAVMARVCRVSVETIRNWQRWSPPAPLDVVEKLMTWEKAHPIPLSPAAPKKE